MLPGTQCPVITPGHIEKRHLISAFEPSGGRPMYVEGDRKASWRFLCLPRTQLASCRDSETIHVILDNVAIHKSRLVRARLAEFADRLRLHLLLLYCPVENRID